MNIIKLTYDEKNIRKNVKVQKKSNLETGNLEVRTKTIVSIPCIFKEVRINKELADFGFVTFPEGIRNILNRYGFRYDYKMGGWVKEFTGVAVHFASIKENGETIQSDQYSEEYGFNVAISRAKLKSQLVARNIMEQIAGVFQLASETFSASADHFNEIYHMELDGHKRVVETGYYNPIH